MSHRQIGTVNRWGVGEDPRDQGKGLGVSEHSSMGAVSKLGQVPTLVVFGTEFPIHDLICFWKAGFTATGRCKCLP